jgi:hypothetical protein
MPAALAIMGSRVVSVVDSEGLLSVTDSDAEATVVLVADESEDIVPMPVMSQEARPIDAVTAADRAASFINKSFFIKLDVPP